MIARAACYVPMGHPAPRGERICKECKVSVMTSARNLKVCPACFPAHKAKIARKANIKRAAKLREERRIANEASHHQRIAP